MSDLLARIAARQLSGSTSPESDTAPDAPKIPAFVGVLLKQLGMTPEKLLASVSEVLTPLLERLDKIDARLTTIDEKLAAVESNQTILLRDQSEDERVELMRDSLPVDYKLNMNGGHDNAG